MPCPTAIILSIWAICIGQSVGHALNGVRPQYETIQDITVQRGGFLQASMTEYIARTITPNNRTLCPESEENPRPPNRVDTDERVRDLRAVMTNRSLTGGNILDAYIVRNGDEHMTSSSGERNARLGFISGYSGSSGFAIVTADKAAMWTDGRYFLQADQQMDCNWILMQQGISGYPTPNEWLLDEISAGGYVGAFASIFDISTWLSYETGLSEGGINMEAVVPRDLIDYVWTENRPELVTNDIYIHDLEFAGVAWEDKVAEIRTHIAQSEASVLLVTALDETAWLFNLRGSDKPNSPLFDSYALVSETDIRLYLRNPSGVLDSTELREHLGTSDTGTCSAGDLGCVAIVDYDDIFDDIRALSNEDSVTGIWIAGSSNYATYEAAGDKRYIADSPVAFIKSIKNPTEREQYAKCQIRDSIAVIEFAAFMENEMASGNSWTELQASDKITEFRSTKEHYKGISFTPISAVGANAAVIHYRPTNDTDTPLTTDRVYLLDSGGQYLDGTTDVTRTFHFGTPADIEQEAYTRVLMGVIDLATTIWPDGLYGSDIDARARATLWQHGWDYQHGTGHGIGYFLNIHEVVGRINIGFSDIYYPLHEGMYFSDEPGFYDVNNNFGIRLETIVQVIEANTPNQFAGRYLGFHPVTLVPFEPKMIKYEMLEAKQRRWLNEYHARCLAAIGPILQEADNQLAYDWLMTRVAPIPDVPVWTTTSHAAPCRQSMSLLTLISLLSLVLVFAR